ncbi:MAG TPA: cyclodeaminase/cyclohydrolase family protein [Thermoanaerobaculia bacterium]|jgi:formiminotetrahydrofolate cyclodeaminase|nr:cyclodeaminase/cyclohydrolase family protein [Thermoanaerobaculia bacterium]
MSFSDRSTGDLLDLFAAGKNVPGAGSAAALQGALAGSLLQAVAKYSKAEGLLNEAREKSERLRKAMDEDAAAFQQFWQSRTSEALARATEIPIAIARDCAALAAIGLELHEKGFKNARGESAAAAWGALAAGEAAVYVARLNQASRAEELRSLAGELRGLRRRLEDATG